MLRGQDKIGGSFVSAKPYLMVSSFIFFLVAMFHLARLVYRWPVLVGSRVFPSWPSYVAVGVGLGLCVRAYGLSRK